MPDRMTVDEDELGTRESLSVDDTGTLNLSFRVVGVRHKTEYHEGVMNSVELDELEYDLEFSIVSAEVDERSLQDSLRSALKEQEPIRVKSTVAPYPG